MGSTLILTSNVYVLKYIHNVNFNSLKKFKFFDFELSQQKIYSKVEKL